MRKKEEKGGGEYINVIFVSGAINACVYFENRKYYFSGGWRLGWCFKIQTPCYQTSCSVGPKNLLWISHQMRKKD
jgi:hypothetical protein